jgi:hypothetical protein
MEIRNSWVTRAWTLWDNLDFAPRLSGILIFGGTSAVVLIFYLIYHSSLITSTTLIIAICIHLLDFLIPYGIYIFETKVLPSFFNAAKKVITDEEKLNQIHEKCISSFVLKHWWFSLSTATLAMVVFFTKTSMVKILAIEVSFTNPFYWIALFHIMLIFHLGGMVLSFINASFFAIRAAASLLREVHPLHPDRCGGLKFFGTLSLRITSWIARGSFILPPLFVLNPGSITFVALFSIIFSIIIFSTFLYPMKVVSKRARFLKDRALYDLWEKILYCEQKSEKYPEHERLSLFIQIQELRFKYQELQKLNIYPININTITKLSTLVLLPLMFLVLNLYLDKII